MILDKTYYTHIFRSCLFCLLVCLIACRPSEDPAVKEAATIVLRSPTISSASTIAATIPSVGLPETLTTVPTRTASSPATAAEPTRAASPPATSTAVTPTPIAGSLPTGTPPPPVRFAVIGDYGLVGPPAEAVARLVISWAPDFVITTGDNNYPDGEADTIDANIGQYYSGFIGHYQGDYGPGAPANRFFPTLGNHDWHSADLPYLNYFTLPGNERYYDFVWGPVHLLALDSDSREPDGVSAGSVQAGWLRERLAASPEPWRIVYMHHAPYSSGQHGSVTWMRWPFREWGATAVLAGHDHVYERLFIDGLPYFINGLGGYPARYAFDDPLPGSQFRYNADYGAMLITATPQRLTFQFITVTGELIDSYELTAPPSAP